MSDRCFCHLNGYKVKDADARKKIQEIDDYVSHLDYKFGIGKNKIGVLIKGETITTGGHIQKVDAYERTDFIYLKQGTYVYSNSSNNLTLKLGIYDLNKNFERYLIGDNATTFKLTEPKFIILSDIISRQNKQLEEGDTPTEYEPYTSFKAIQDERYNNRKKRNYILIGDSYGVGALKQNDVVGWMGIAEELLNNNPTTASVTLSGLGGTGFIAENDGINFLTLLELSEENLPVEKSEITDIVVCGGYNDKGYSSGEISIAINSFVEYANHTFPNALVSIGMIGTSARTSDSSITASIATNSLTGYCGTTTHSGVCYRYLENVENILKMNPDYMDTETDDIHPSELGYISLANGIVKALMGGFSNGCATYRPLIKGVSGVSFSDDDDISNSVAVIVSGNVTSIQITKIIANIDKNIIPSFNGNEWFDLFTFENSLITGATGGNNTTSINGFYKKTDGTRENFSGVARIKNGVFQIAHHNFDSTGNYLSDEVDLICVSYSQFVSPTNLY